MGRDVEAYSNNNGSRALEGAPTEGDGNDGKQRCLPY